MHNENEYKYALSKYRLEKAQESLKYAKILMDNDGYAETVNRAYYAIFHATRAILAIDGVDRKRHSGVISYFQENYVKTGIFDKECSYILKNAFSIRQESDYEDFYVISGDEAKAQIENAEFFVKKVAEYLSHLQN